MCPESTCAKSICPAMTLTGSAKYRQRGFSLPIAVFILVIMALLAAAIVQLSSRSNLSASQEELSNRAFYAAESGASWGLSRLFFSELADADKSFSDGRCDALGPMPVIDGVAGLYTCSVSVTCSRNSVGAIGYYTVTSTGTCGSGQASATRSIEVGAKNGS